MAGYDTSGVSRTLIKVATTKAGLDATPAPYIPDPSSLQWGLQSVSNSDAGRDQNGKMHVNWVKSDPDETQKRKLELAWNGVDFATTAEILQAFNHETFWVEYWDALENRALQKKFYVGDRTAPVNSYSDGQRWYTTVAFNIIEV